MTYKHQTSRAATPFALGFAALIANKSNHNDQHWRYHCGRSYTRRVCDSMRKLYVRPDSVPFPTFARTNDQGIIELSAVWWTIYYPVYNAIPLSFVDFCKIQALKRRFVSTPSPANIWIFAFVRFYFWSVPGLKFHIFRSNLNI